MSLYDGIDTPETKTVAGGFSANKMNLSFLKTQLEAKKAQLQSTHKGLANTPAPVINLAGQRGGGNAPGSKSLLNLKPRKALPLPADSSGGFTIVPRALKEEKVFLFGEITVEDEYNPTAPTDYATYKPKREVQRAKERAAKEIAERLQKQHTEEEMKRRAGAAIAPPQALIEQDRTPAQSTPAANPAPPAPVVLDTSSHFGKGATRGLGIAANIMSKMGYRQGAGLGRAQQGMSTALRVEQTGKNTGMIVGESAGIASSSLDSEEFFDDVDERMDTIDGAQPSVSSASVGSTPSIGVAPPTITDKLKHSTKVVLLQNMVQPAEVDAELEAETREEMAKYGQVNTVIIHLVPNAPVDEAVRIFVEFANVSQAIKAVVDLNGRFFGGRPVQANFYSPDDFVNRLLEK